MFILLGAALAAPLSPDEAVAHALPVHPDVARAEATLAAARGEARQTAFLGTNPALAVGYALVGERVEVGLSQDVSLTGEGVAAHRAAKARVEAAEHSLRRARLQAAADVRVTWVEATTAAQTAVLTADAFDLSTRLLRATDARVTAGEAADLDLRLARMDQTAAARDLLVARSEAAEALAELSALVQRPVVVEDLVGDALTAAPEPDGRATERSDVAAARALANAAESELSRSQSGILPPVSIGGFVEVDSGNLVAGPTLGLTLPLWHQNQAATGVARGEVAATHAELSATTARAEAQVRSATDLSRDTSAVLDQLGTGLDGDARAALQSIERGFAAGELDFITTTFLRAQLVEGRTAILETAATAARIRIGALLANEDPALLGGAP